MGMTEEGKIKTIIPKEPVCASPLSILEVSKM
jgi:hypothetical protein